MGTTVDGIPVTTVARTLLDLSSCIGPVLLARMLDDAVRRRLVRVDELRACYEALTVQGRRKTRVVRALLDERLPGLRPGDSEREQALVQVLLEADLGRAAQQYQVVAGGRVYLLDLAYPDERVGVEYDGFAEHTTFTAFTSDHRRDADLDAAGWTAYRFDRTTPKYEAVERVRGALARSRRASPP